MVKSGRTGFVPMPCPGTMGKKITNDTADVDVPSAVNVGATSSQVYSNYIKGGGALAITKSDLADITLGDGALKIDAVQAQAAVKKNKFGKVVKKTPFTRVLGLTVNGEPQALPVDGQELEIPGVARIQTGVVQKFPRGLKVTALRVTLLDAAPDPIQVDIGNAGAYIVR